MAITNNEIPHEERSPQTTHGQNGEWTAPTNYPSFSGEQAGQKSRNRRRAGIAVASLAVVAVAAVGVSEMVKGDSSNSKSTAQRSGRLPQAAGSTPAQQSPSSIPSSLEVTPQAVRPGTIDLTTIVPNEDITLNVPQAVVPEYVADPLKDPTARFNAFLADYSYYLSAPDDTTANIALSAMTNDPNVQADLHTMRTNWQLKSPNQMLWFWTEPTETGSIVGKDNGDGTTSIVANEKVYFQTVTKPNGIWGDPGSINKEGAASIQGMVLTYANGGDGLQQRDDLIKSEILGVDSGGAPAVFPG